MDALDAGVRRRALAATKILARLGVARAAYVFGSHVEGIAHAWSDIDVAAFREGLEDWDIRRRATAMAMEEAGSDVETHLFPASALDSPPASFAEYILRHGTPILDPQQRRFPEEQSANSTYAPESSAKEYRTPFHPQYPQCGELVDDRRTKSLRNGDGHRRPCCTSPVNPPPEKGTADLWLPGFTRACQTVLAAWMLLSTGACRDVAALHHTIFAHIAANTVADRPGRIEPRALKRCRERYPLMTRPRQQLRAERMKT